MEEGWIKQKDWFYKYPTANPFIPRKGKWLMPEAFVGLNLYIWDIYCDYFNGSLERENVDLIDKILDKELDGFFFGECVDMEKLKAKCREYGKYKILEILE